MFADPEVPIKCWKKLQVTDVDVQMGPRYGDVSTLTYPWLPDEFYQCNEIHPQL